MSAAKDSAGREVLRLSLGTSALAMATIALLAVPAYAEVLRGDYRLANAEVGALTSVFALVYVCVQIPGGVIGSVLGLGRTLAACFTLLAIAFVGATLTDSFALLVLFRALAGLGAGSLLPLGSAVVVSVDPRRNSRRQGIFASGWGLGYVAGLTALPLLFASWRVAFVVSGIASLALAAVSLWAGGSAAGERATLGEATGSLRRAGTWLLGISLFGVALVNSGVGAWAVLLGREHLNLSESGAASLSSLIGWGLIPSSIAAAALARRTTERFVVLMTSGLLAGAILLLLMPPTRIGVALAFLAVGWCSGASLGVMLGLVQRVAPTPGARGQGAAVGGLNVVAFSANIVAPPAVAFAGQQLGQLSNGFVVLLIGPVIAAIAGLRALAAASASPSGAGNREPPGVEQTVSEPTRLS
jgi:predicted MFS family arabinose efflux permease